MRAAQEMPRRIAQSEFHASLANASRQIVPTNVTPGDAKRKDALHAFIPRPATYRSRCARAPCPTTRPAPALDAVKCRQANSGHFEFFADKIAGLDSAWDAVHTLIRPVGGALLALAIIDPHDPAWQVASLLLGSGAALLSHGAKAGARAAVNVSPEPFSNVIVSTGEDVVTTGLLAATIASPVAAVAIAVLLAGGAVAMLVLLRRLYRRVTRRKAAPVTID